MFCRKILSDQSVLRLSDESCCISLCMGIEFLAFFPFLCSLKVFLNLIWSPRNLSWRRAEADGIKTELNCDAVGHLIGCSEYTAPAGPWQQTLLCLVIHPSVFYTHFTLFRVAGGTGAYQYILSVLTISPQR